ncbi:hypothetical protein L9F63_011724, partial [Diploptera punctata]
MGTKAAAFTAKIRNLHDYQLRLLHNIMPVPSGGDVANTLKYFSQMLLNVLRDVPSSPIEMLKSLEKDSVRLGLYPNLDYKGLYNAIVQLTDVVPLIQYGLNAFGQAILQCLGCLLPFLDRDMIDTLPYLTASLMAVFPSSLHQDIVNSLCFYILPFTITRRDDEEQENYASQSVAAIIMMVFQYSEDPDLVPFVCQRDMCPNAGNAEAAKNCRGTTDKYAVSICFSTECASYNGNHPIRYCQQCHNIRHNNRRGGDHIVHTSLPQLWDMDAEVQTYMVEAIVSLLKEAKALNADMNKESAEAQVKASLLNVVIEDPIALEERQLLGRYGVWLLVGLCTPHEDTPAETLGRLLSMLFHWFDITSYTFDDQESTIERLKTEFVCSWLTDVCNSHFPVFVSCLLPHPPEYARVGGHWNNFSRKLWSCAGRMTEWIHWCQDPYTFKGWPEPAFQFRLPYESISPDIWGYFVMPHWMAAKGNDVPEKELSELRNLLRMSCNGKILDPDMSPLGFDANKLYNFVAIRFKKTSAKVQEQALSWLQILTVLDIVIPLQQLFSMFSDGVRVMKGNPKDEKHSKHTKTEDGVKKGSPVKETDDISPSPVVEDSSGNTSGLSDDEGPTMRNVGFETDAELTLSCCILMLDVLLSQMELQEIEMHCGVHTSLSEDVCKLLKCMVSASWVGAHTCASKNDCAFCESSVMWHQLALETIEYLSPENPVNPPDSQVDEQAGDESGHGRKGSPESDKKSESKPDVVINMPIPEFHSVGVVLMHVPH